VKLVAPDVQPHRGAVVEDDVEVGADDLQADLAERIEALGREERHLAPGREKEAEQDRTGLPEPFGNARVGPF
jgi:hypothetical protein